MKQEYVAKNFKADTLNLIDHIITIVDEYQAQGFVLTVRQLYYQLVARAIIPNTLQEYKRAAGVINDAKLAGMIDWDAIEDRTRDFVRQTRWNSGADILRAAVSSFHKDMWVGQDYRVFVIVEKEALVGVLERACRDNDVPLLAARGYPSGTVLREFAQSDLLPAFEAGQMPVILHLGDHDPSGIDMSRDLEDRLVLFCDEQHMSFERIALNMKQVQALKPPENPAKITDSRFEGYKRLHGDKSWELDALSPTFLDQLLRKKIATYIETTLWEEIADEVTQTKTDIIELAKGFE